MVVSTEAGSSELQQQVFREEKKSQFMLRVCSFSGTLSHKALLDALHILFHCLFIIFIIQVKYYFTHILDEDIKVLKLDW